MKTLIRSYIYNIICLYTASIIIPGFKIGSDYRIIFLGGGALTVLNLFLKPIAKVLFFPINLVTMGLFSWIINVAILYLLIYFIPKIAVSGWNFAGFYAQGFSIPSIYFNKLLTVILTSFFLSFVSSFLNWVRK